MVPVTAICRIALMVGAMITQGCLGQSKLVLLNSACLAPAALIVRGRLGSSHFGS